MENRSITVNVVTPLLKGLVTLHVIYAAMLHCVNPWLPQWARIGDMSLAHQCDLLLSVHVCQ